MSWLLALITASIGFLFGKVFSQSEQILSDKRRVYEEFLRCCPQPNDYLGSNVDTKLENRSAKLDDLKGPMMVYASPSVMQALSVYLLAIAKILDKLSKGEASNSLIQYATSAQNNLVLEMRRDLFALSIFAHRGKPQQLEPPAD